MNSWLDIFIQRVDLKGWGLTQEKSLVACHSDLSLSDLFLISIFQSFKEETDGLFIESEGDFKIEGRPSALGNTILKVSIKSYQ